MLMYNNGIFGKLPAHGDFVQRNFPGSFLTPWDEWLQRAVHGAREMIGEGWLDYYLTSPIWRFAFSPGVLDEQGWAGVLVPSVDSVGRYYPLTFAASQPEDVNIFSIMANQKKWYEELSDLAIESLQNTLLVDQVLGKFPAATAAGAAEISGSCQGGLITVNGAKEIEHSYPFLVEKMLNGNAGSHSLWWCSGSQFLPPTTMLCSSLPDPSVYCAMLGAGHRSW
ncbi:type VI secretion system-associated protein TagF [Microbulbifer agarilyticus]|uniref:type VI secretion system-associated protein TagF n=1 Tax=Microbulbifer agarilyticus TaxID=260552 RepID=UPI001C947CDB|nr:type VI secretion system-associated protein TagF [Microbulbifer agarilyticus]MBY6189990.1 type VI secretion system-associated protein TagF [Microbulbifer agarilyticus]